MVADQGGLPEGTITFVLTDVVGSTRLWEQHPTAMSAVMERHDRLIAQIVAHHGGSVVRARSEGDSSFAVFRSAPDAVACCLGLQRAFRDEPWPEGISVPIRVGALTGSAERTGTDYAGTAVNRCARIRDLAGAGHVLLAETTTEVIRDVLPTGASLRELGEVRLRGLSRPERIFQLRHADLPDDTPEIRTADVPNNIPARLTNFVGREDERRWLESQLTTGPRVVTLTGSGGAGKTRLALEAATDVMRRFEDGVWFVELGGLGRPDLVPNQVASVLQVREQRGRSIVDEVIDRLRGARALLVLDNCEHVIAAAAALVGTLLQACTSLRVLATSREPLGVGGEVRLPVPPLAVPDVDDTAALEEISAADSVALFLDRARLVRPGFDADAGNVHALASIVRRLDGIPLAIELAAARIATMTVEEIARRIEDRFWLLSHGPRTAPSRHKTLRLAVDWGHELLDESERALFRRLSVFAGWFGAEQASSICSGTPIDERDVVLVLSSLVDKSFLVRESADGATAYRMLETIRLYAREKLDAAGETAEVRNAHLTWCCRFVDQARPQIHGPSPQSWLDRMEDEHDDIREALNWARSGGDAAVGLRLAAGMGGIWTIRGYESEGRQWLESLLALAATAGDDVRAHGLRAIGILAMRQGEVAVARSYLDQALALARECGDRHGEAEALEKLGGVALMGGEVELASSVYQEALGIFRELGEARAEATTLARMGNIAIASRDHERARTLLMQSLAIRRELGNVLGIAEALFQLGGVAANRRRFDEARPLFEEALAIARPQGWNVVVAPVLNSLGYIEQEEGDQTAARELFDEALGINRELGNRPGVAASVLYLGDSARLTGSTEEARTLLEEALAMYRSLGLPAGAAEALNSLGHLMVAAGEASAAQDALREAIATATGIGNRSLVLASLAGLAAIQASRGNEATAAVMLGGIKAHAAALGWAPTRAAREGLASTEAGVRSAMGEEAFAAAQAKGSALDFDDLVGYADES